MSSWRFPRSSTRSLPQPTSPPSERRHSDDDPSPPRYSNLTSLEGTQTPPPHSLSAPPNSTDTTERSTRSSRFSLASWSSRFSSSPSYITNDPETRSISSSTRTLADPPRYSTLSQNSRAARDGVNGGGRAVSTSEYTFDITTGFKSERWATLRLYDETSSSHGGSRKKRHPRFSNMDTMFGTVELLLSSSQTVKSIELTLKGSIITGAVGDGGSTSFLEQGYTIWDREFGDPRLLADDSTHDSSKYDGKLSGNWIFPFSIPFPTHVDMSTLRAIYPRESEGPVRFLPELLHEDSQLSPFCLDGGPTRTQPSFHPAPVHPSHIAPFDISVPHTLTEKGGLVSSHTEIRTQVPTTRFTAPIPTAPSIPSIEPYLQHRSEASNALPPSSGHTEKLGRLPPHRTSGINSQRLRGATSMQVPELPTAAIGYLLPQSFLERDVMVNVQYELALTITHGRFSTKSRVNIPIIYAPVTVPSSMTLGRQRAYRHREIPPSPDLDPGGWKQLPTVSIRGTFNDRMALTINYTLSLATPLSYTRVIPCYLSISCDDTSALNLFADPRTPRVRLRRSIRFLHSQAGVGEQAVGPTWLDGGGSLGNNTTPNRPRLSRTPLRLSQSKKGSPTLTLPDIEPFVPEAKDSGEEETLGSSDETDGRDIGDRAVWCAPANLTQELQVRKLYGEIRLPRELQPSCKSPLFNILYHIELLAPATNAFVPDTEANPSPRKTKATLTDLKEEAQGERVYLSHYVEITTNSRRDEPTPIPLVWVTDPVAAASNRVESSGSVLASLVNEPV